MMKEFKLTKAQEQCLREQEITAERPGPVLHDFRALPDFLGPEGVEASGKYNLLPMKLIDELDQLLSRPLRLKSQRPQIRSHPYIHGLNLLLRASGLSRIEGKGAKARLVLDQAMVEQWDQLNPTEQYFNLLEAWLRLGRAEMVGESGRFSQQLWVTCVQAWQSVPETGDRYDTRKPNEVYISGIHRDFYQLALMDLFGLLEVLHPSHQVVPWGPAGLKRVPYGDAVFTLLFSRLDVASAFVPFQVEEGEDPDEETPRAPHLGAWQPFFEPYFPEWRENLKFAEPEPRAGTFLFRASLGKVWRLIAMPPESTLDDLVDWILHSVEFDDDHLYEFTYRDRLGRKATAGHPAMDDGPWADQVTIGLLPLEPGGTMDLLYDFGDCWKFKVKLERVEPPHAKVKAPRIVESHGKAPEQYQSWDE